jgi:hypothetical protein
MVAIGIFAVALFVGVGAEVFAQTTPDPTGGISVTQVAPTVPSFIDFSAVVGSIANVAQPIIIGVVCFALGLFCLRFFLRLVKSMGR